MTIQLDGWKQTKSIRSCTPQLLPNPRVSNPKRNPAGLFWIYWSQWGLSSQFAHQPETHQFFNTCTRCEEILLVAIWQCRPSCNRHTRSVAPWAFVRRCLVLGRWIQPWCVFFGISSNKQVVSAPTTKPKVFGFDSQVRLDLFWRLLRAEHKQLLGFLGSSGSAGTRGSCLSGNFPCF